LRVAGRIRVGTDIPVEAYVFKCPKCGQKRLVLYLLFLCAFVAQNPLKGGSVMLNGLRSGRGGVRGGPEKAKPEGR